MQRDTNTESQQAGYETVTHYRLCLVGAPILGAQAQVEWQGKRWSLDGDPVIYTDLPEPGMWTTPSSGARWLRRAIAPP
jgi:hypothetical protein